MKIPEQDSLDLELAYAIQDGLPLTPRPYATIGERLGISEAEVMTGIQDLLERNAIQRLGVVVRHHELGYRANAMVVWDVPDAEVEPLGLRIAKQPHVNLCYQRPRRPHWPYNLFCMIHGQDRQSVLERLDTLIDNCSLKGIPHEVLFSLKRFKQRGARYNDQRQARKDP
jgi:DNA-binding Lrp family transcriptional regulator